MFTCRHLIDFSRIHGDYTGRVKHFVRTKPEVPINNLMVVIDPLVLPYGASLNTRSRTVLNRLFLRQFIFENRRLEMEVVWNIFQFTTKNSKNQCLEWISHNHASHLMKVHSDLNVLLFNVFRSRLLSFNHCSS